jgi:oligopeptide transport system substrate-binding protein
VKRLAALLTVLSIAIAGCTASAVHRQAAVHHHVATSTLLRWGLVGLADVPTLDPALASDATSISLASLIYGGLVRLDSRLQVQPDGAARWTISRDGRVYTFFLRPNLRFPDGRRVSANDFAVALRRALGPQASAGTASFYLGLIAHRTWFAHGAMHLTRGITVVNRTTLRIRLVHPAAHFLAELAFPPSYVPDPHLIARYGAGWTDHAAGFGPFSVRVWRHSRYLSLQRNPYYYAGKPHLQRISLHFYQQAGTAMAEYRRGELDLISGIQAGQTVTSRPAGTESRPGLALDYLAFNTTRLPFSRLNARRAFAAAWTPELTAGAMQGAGFPARDFLPSAFGVSVPRWRPSRPASTYLSWARYPRGRHFPAVTLVAPQDAHVRALAEQLHHAWHRSLGLDIPIRLLNSSDYGAVLNAHAFDLAIVRWGADYPDPQDFLATQLGSSPDNVTRWSGRRYSRDLLLADSYSPQDPRRKALFQQAAGIAAAKVALVPLDEPAQTAVISPKLSAVALTPLGTITGDWARAILIV